MDPADYGSPPFAYVGNSVATWIDPMGLRAKREDRPPRWWWPPDWSWWPKWPKGPSKPRPTPGLPPAPHLPALPGAPDFPPAEICHPDLFCGVAYFKAYAALHELQMVPADEWGPEETKRWNEARTTIRACVNADIGPPPVGGNP